MNHYLLYQSLTLKPFVGKSQQIFWGVFYHFSGSHIKGLIRIQV